jgi:hypothetical protein
MISFRTLLLLACLCAALHIAPADATVNVTWTKLSNMLLARSDIMIVSDSEYAYAAGGCVGAHQLVAGNGCPTITDMFTRYSFAANAWSVLPSMPRPRYRYASALYGGAIFFIGGRDSADNFIEIIVRANFCYCSISILFVA